MMIRGRLHSLHRCANTVEACEVGGFSGVLCGIHYVLMRAFMRVVMDYCEGVRSRSGADEFVKWWRWQR